MKKQLTIKILELDFFVIKADIEISDELFQHNSDFISITKTKEEISIVTDVNPQDLGDLNKLRVESGYKCLKIVEQLDFSLIGIIADISSKLAKSKVSIFVISTFNTDYILVKQEDLSKAVSALETNYQILE